MSKKPYNPQMKIFFLGPEGTNSDLASRNIFTEKDTYEAFKQRLPVV